MQLLRVCHLSAVSMLVLGTASGREALGAYLATPEGQQAAGQLAGGAAGAAVNPLNPLAWYDIALGGGALLAAIFGLKTGGKGLQAAGRLVKRHVLNPTPTEA